MSLVDNNCTDGSYLPRTSEFYTSFGGYATAMYTLASLLTITQLVLYLHTVWLVQHYAAPQLRHPTSWVTSIYWFISLMSLVSIILPKSVDVCDTFKQIYMAFCMTKFVDQTMSYFGGEVDMFDSMRGSAVNLRSPPLCCCCFFCPTLQLDRRLFRLLMLMVYQLKYIQPAYLLCSLILATSGLYHMGEVSPSDSALWLNIINALSFISGMWGMMMILQLTTRLVTHDKYTMKTVTLKMVMVFVKIQGFLFSLLYKNEVFPCLVPYISSRMFSEAIMNCLLIVELQILSLLNYRLYKQCPGQLYQSEKLAKGNNNKQSPTSTSVQQIDVASLNETFVI